MSRKVPRAEQTLISSCFYDMLWLWCFFVVGGVPQDKMVVGLNPLSASRICNWNCTWSSDAIWYQFITNLRWCYNYCSIGRRLGGGDLHSLLPLNLKCWGYKTDHRVWEQEVPSCYIHGMEVAERASECCSAQTRQVRLLNCLHMDQL